MSDSEPPTHVSVEEHALVKARLLAALDLPAAQQEAYVADLDRCEPAVAGRVRRLLDAHREAGAFLNVPDDERQAVARAPYTRIGPFTIERELGRGGMGVVLLGAREDVSYTQRVAIKVIRDLEPATGAAQRLLEERRILASLNHPSIAHFVDGGTTPDGLPYLAMEFVEGIPITDFCTAHALTVRQRLALVLKVCDAVQFAHQRLVVHRDIKPSNILVTAEGLPKLLDFGIAKLTDPRSTAQTVTMRVLTPRYASPEQAAGGTVTTSTDVYSLGVLLYELVTGSGPYRSVSPDSDPLSLLEAIRHEPVERPSLAARRGNREPIDADLDAVLLKALRKDEADRYRSVDHLAADLTRHRDGRPVEARAGSRTYLARKFIGRHRGAVAAATAIVVAITAGGAATAWQARIARQERDRAQNRLRQVQEFSRSLLFEVHDSLRRVPGATESRRLLLDRAVQFLDGLTADAGNDVDLMGELAIGYFRLGDVQGSASSENLGDTQAALASFDKMARLTDRMRVLRPDMNALMLSVDAYLSVATLHMDRGAPEPSKAALTQMGTFVRELEGRFRDEAPAIAKVAQGYSGEGYLINRFRDLAGTEQTDELSAAEQAYERSSAAFSRLPTADRTPDRLARHSEMLRRLAATQLRLGRLEDSARRFREALAMDEGAVARDPSDPAARYTLSITLADLGLVLANQGRLAEATSLWTRALDIRRAAVEADPSDVRAMSGVATLLGRLGEAAREEKRYADAIPYDRERLAMRHTLVTRQGSIPTALAERAFAQLDLATMLLNVAEASSGRDRLALVREARTIADAIAIEDGRRNVTAGNASEFSEKYDTLRAQLRRSTPRAPRQRR